MTFVVLAIGFLAFAKYVVVVPAFKREFLVQLQKGYELRDECGDRNYYDDVPAWMRDSQEGWKAVTGSLIVQSGKADDLQVWRDSRLVGLVTDANKNGFRCTEMAVKVAALETIIARHYDKTMKPNPYTGPVYTFNPATGSSMQPPNKP